MGRATRCCGIAFHSSCTRRRKSRRLVFSSTRRSTASFTRSHKCSIGHPPSKDTHLFATFESVLIQALKQLWDSNHYSSVAMTQLFMCAKNHFDWLISINFGNMRPNPKGNLFLLNCLYQKCYVYKPQEKLTGYIFRLILNEQRKIYSSRTWTCDLRIDVPVLYQLS